MILRMTKGGLPALVLLVVFTLGCQAPKPFVYHPDTETKAGPGLFSGENGRIVIHGAEPSSRLTPVPEKGEPKKQE